jgi:GNAT superfamily N-acetyltransferase
VPEGARLEGWSPSISGRCGRYLADKLFGGLSPECSRLLIARSGDALVGWVHIQRNPSPLVAHWGTISHLQSLPSARGQGIGSALMMRARQVARSEMGLEQLRLAVRGGTRLEHFYARPGVDSDRPLARCAAACLG